MVMIGRCDGLDGTDAKLLVRRSPRLPRRREARGSEPSIAHLLAKLLKEVLDQDESLLSLRIGSTNRQETLVVESKIVVANYVLQKVRPRSELLA